MAAGNSLAAGLQILPAGIPSSTPTGAASLSEHSKNAGKTAEEFESMVLGEFISAMFTTHEKGLFSPGHAGEIYRSLLTQEYGKALAKSGGIGIAHELQREILKLQEVPKK